MPLIDPASRQAEVLAALKRAIHVELDHLPAHTLRRHLAYDDHAAAAALGASTWRVARELGIAPTLAHRHLLSAVAARTVMVEGSTYSGGLRWWPVGYCRALRERSVA